MQSLFIMLPEQTIYPKYMTRKTLCISDVIFQSVNIFKKLLLERKEKDLKLTFQLLLKYIYLLL